MFLEDALKELREMPQYVGIYRAEAKDGNCIYPLFFVFDGKIGQYRYDGLYLHACMPLIVGGISLPEMLFDDQWEYVITGGLSPESFYKTD